MIRVISLNLNGIRSAARKGLVPWLESQNADVVCVQELKAQEADIVDELRQIDGMQGHFFTAQKKGYSGVGVYTRRQPKEIKRGYGVQEFDDEGRIIELDYGRYSVISVYVPSGTSSEERLQAKFRFMESFGEHLRQLRAQGREIVLCGDWNIAHNEIDLRNWRSNRKNSGFLPEERAWLTWLFDELGFVDVFRQLEPGPDQYTWWSNRGQAWANNVGWRLDYQVATPGLAAKARSTRIHVDDRFSDHAPVIIDYAYRR